MTSVRPHNSRTGAEEEGDGRCDTTNVVVVNNEAMICQIIIHLNNCAVTLLGTYNNHIAAIQTMKDALEILQQQRQQQQQQQRAPNGRTSGSNTLPSSIANVSELHRRVLHNASQRIHFESQQQNCYSDISESQQQQPQQQQLHECGTPKMNDIGVVVMSCHYNPNDAYHLLATIRTSKVAIRIDDCYIELGCNNTDYFTNMHVVRSILVYNYGIAHRCCSTLTMPAPTAVQGVPTNRTVVTTATTPTSIATNNRVGTFCFQIFQYAEQLLLPALDRNYSDMINNDNENNTNRNVNERQHYSSSIPASDPASNNNSSSNYLLLYRFVLTRNLMMISCKMGMLLCEQYKQTLDPIESEILLLTPQILLPPPPQQNNNDSNSNGSQQQITEQQQRHGTEYHKQNNDWNASAA